MRPGAHSARHKYVLLARFFRRGSSIFYQGKKTRDPTLRIVASCKNILDKCIDVETNLSVDTPEFRESSRAAVSTCVQNIESDTSCRFMRGYKQREV